MKRLSKANRELLLRQLVLDGYANNQEGFFVHWGKAIPFDVAWMAFLLGYWSGLVGIANPLSISKNFVALIETA